MNTAIRFRSRCFFGVLASLLGVAASAAPPPPQAFIRGTFNRQVEIGWTSNPQTNWYELWSRPNDGAAWVKFATVPAARTSANNHVSAHLVNWEELLYQVRACNPSGCSASSDLGPFVPVPSTNVTVTIKPSRTQSGAKFGSAIDISEDGGTLVSVSASEDDVQSGRQAVVNIYLFNSHYKEYWKQEARIFPSVTQPNSGAGVVANLSGDGNVLIVGVPAERADASESAQQTGAAYLFRRVVDGTWRQERRFAPAAGAPPAHYGFAAEISEDGNTVMIGRMTDGGTAEVYTYLDGEWTRTATVPGPGNDVTCARLRLSGDGSTVARVCSKGPFYRSLQVFRAPSYALDIDDNVFGQDEQFPADLAVNYAGSIFAVSQVGAIQGSSGFVIYRGYANGQTTRNCVFEGFHSWQDNSIAQSEFGGRVALSRGGDDVAVRDIRDTGAGEGPIAPTLKPGTQPTGAVFIYHWSGRCPGLRRVLKPNYGTHVPAQGFFEGELSFANDGKTLVVSQPGDTSSATTPYHWYSADVKPDAGGAVIY